MINTDAHMSLVAVKSLRPKDVLPPIWSAHHARCMRLVAYQVLESATRSDSNSLEMLPLTGAALSNSVSTQYGLRPRPDLGLFRGSGYLTSSTTAPLAARVER